MATGLSDPFNNTTPAPIALAQSAFNNGATAPVPFLKGVMRKAKYLVTGDIDSLPIISGQEQCFDGGSIGAEGDLLLLIGQGEPQENGLYQVIAGGRVKRVAGADTAAALEAGLVVQITGGDNHIDEVYQLCSGSPITLETTPLRFSLVSGANPRPL